MKSASVCSSVTVPMTSQAYIGGRSSPHGLPVSESRNFWIRLCTHKLKEQQPKCCFGAAAQTSLPSPMAGPASITIHQTSPRINPQLPPNVGCHKTKPSCAGKGLCGERCLQLWRCADLSEPRCWVDVLFAFPLLPQPVLGREFSLVCITRWESGAWMCTSSH